MFYTLASRIPLVSGDKTSKNFLKVFIVGSILYVYVHYYLYSGERWYVLEKLKSYLYYVMILDFIITYIIMKWNTPVEEDEELERQANYTAEQKLQNEKDLDELKRMSQMEAYRRKLEEDQEENNKQNDKDDSVSKQSPFMTRDEVRSSEQKESKSNTHRKKSKETTSSTSSSSSHTTEKNKRKKKSNKKKIDVETEVNLPIFMGDN